MKNIAFFLTLQLITFYASAQDNINISFSNNNKDVFHLSLIIYTPDGNIQTRVSDLTPAQVKTYNLPVSTEIYIADLKQEAYAMKGNDIKSTGVKPFLVLQVSDTNRVIELSSLIKK